MLRSFPEALHEHLLAWTDGAGNTGRVLWGITVDETVVGAVRAVCDPINRTAEVSLVVDPGHRDRGIGTNALCSACRTLFRDYEMRKVAVTVPENDTAPIRLCKKLGMVDDGRRSKHFHDGKRAYDGLHFALFREDIPNGNALLDRLYVLTEDALSLSRTEANVRLEGIRSQIAPHLGDWPTWENKY